MSLSSHLKDPRSPIGQFLRTRFAITSAISRIANAQLQSAQPILPAYRQSYPYSLIGMAVDYRLRYYFDVTPEDLLVAYNGAALLTEYVPRYRPQLLENFFISLSQTLLDVKPVGRLLADEDEMLLVRYCFVLALFETVYRSPEIPDLLVSNTKTSVSDLLSLSQVEWVEDLCAISQLFFQQQRQLVAKPFVLNPVFRGSGDVGGADADLIVDGCLLEIKTSIRDSLDPQWLRQLTGYLLLDYDDEYAIRSVGIYMARQGVLFKWPVEEYVRLLTGDNDASVAALRQQFRSEFERVGQLSPSELEAKPVYSGGLAHTALMQRVKELSEGGRCIRCGGVLSFTERRAIEVVTARGRTKLTDNITLHCATCQEDQIFDYQHPKSSKTDLDLLTQSRWRSAIYSRNYMLAIAGQIFDLDTFESSPC